MKQTIHISKLEYNTGQIEGLPANPIKRKGPRMYSCQCCGECFMGKAPSKRQPYKFCSVSCARKASRIIKPCKYCGSAIENINNARMHTRIYCSKACHSAARRGVGLDLKWRMALSDARKKSEKCKGPNLYNWKGGKATEPARFQLHAANRRKKIKLRVDKLFVDSMLVAQRYKCFYCEIPLGEGRHLEHLTAVANGGDNQNFNLVWACKSCNSRKRTRSLEDYAIKTGNIQWIDKWDQMYSTALLLKSKFLEHVSISKIK